MYFNQKMATQQTIETIETIETINPIEIAQTGDETTIQVLSKNDEVSALVVDVSSSMDRMGRTLYSSLNTYIKGIKSQQLTMTGYTFAGPDELTELFYDKLSTEVNFTYKQIQPIGSSTALYSSTCIIIDQLNTRWENLPSNIRKTLIICTDGEENSSRGIYQGENGRLLTKTKIEEFIKNGGIVFFLGANIDAIKVGSNIGVPAETCINFHYSGRGCENVLRTTSNAYNRMRSVDPLDRNASINAAAFNDIERTESMSVPMDYVDNEPCRTFGRTHSIKRSCGITPQDYSGNETQ